MCTQQYLLVSIIKAYQFMEYESLSMEGMERLSKLHAILFALSQGRVGTHNKYSVSLLPQMLEKGVLCQKTASTWNFSATQAVKPVGIDCQFKWSTCYKCSFFMQPHCLQTAPCIRKHIKKRLSKIFYPPHWKKFPFSKGKIIIREHLEYCSSSAFSRPWLQLLV